MQLSNYSLILFVEHVTVVNVQNICEVKISNSTENSKSTLGSWNPRGHGTQFPPILSCLMSINARKYIINLQQLVVNFDNTDWKTYFNNNIISMPCLANLFLHLKRSETLIF